MLELAVVEAVKMCVCTFLNYASFLSHTKETRTHPDFGTDREERKERRVGSFMLCLAGGHTGSDLKPKDFLVIMWLLLPTDRNVSACPHVLKV